MGVIPDFVVGKIIVTDYLDGRTSEAGAKSDRLLHRVAEQGNDLLTAGLGADGIASMTPPLPQHALSPTAAEIRRLSIYNDYRGLLDVSAGGGYHLLFGPKRKVLGREYLAFARPPMGGALFAVLAQIPETFDRRQPMIVTAPSSGSRGIYGAISTAEWAFENGCAVAYTDKGTAPGFHDLDTDTRYGVDGLRLPAGALEHPTFTAAPGPDLDAFKRALPHRLAVKHAHSGTNVEASWGQHVLMSIAFCLFCLNDWLADGAEKFKRPSTKVIAAGVSNGGGAALRAAEQDDVDAPLIDSIVVSEPQVQPKPAAFAIRYAGSVLTNHSRSFLDTVTLMDVYAPCAAFALDASDPTSALQQRRAKRCAALAARGLLKETGTMAQAREALGIIHAHGLLPEADFLVPWHDAFGFWPLLAAVFANAYARCDVNDHLCGVSIAPVDGRGAAVPMSEVMRAQLCGWSSGLGYFVGSERTAVIDDASAGEWSLGAALAFRSLVTAATYQQQNAVEAQWVDAERVVAGIAAVRAGGNLRGKPAIVLHGRCDALLPPNHTSRAYFGLNKSIEQASSRLSYIEIANANHFDTFIALFGADRLVPMHYYFNQALTMMRAHLLDASAPLPPSQVVAATAAHKPWDADSAARDLPALSLAPPQERSITFTQGVVNIPT